MGGVERQRCGRELEAAGNTLQTSTFAERGCVSQKSVLGRLMDITKC